MRINKLRKHIALSLIFMIMFSLVGCVNNENNENSYGGIVGSTEMIRAEKKGNFHLFATKIDSLDPYKVKNYYTQQVLNLIYEGLTVVGSNGELNPGLAKTWTTTDNKSWQFELHSNITWHSGKAFTTNDILYTYNYLKNMNTSIYKKRISNIDNLMINSKNKITFILKKEDADFPYKTAFPILCAKRSKKPNGTGPYAYKSVSSKQLVLKANDKWHLGEFYKSKGGEKAPFVRKIYVNIYKNVNLALGSFLRGELDVYPTKEFKTIDSVKNNYPYNYIQTNKYYYINFNNKSKFLKNVAVRKALAIYLNPSPTVKKIYGDSAIGNSLPKYDVLNSQNKFLTDYKKADKMLKEDGWTKNYSGIWYKSGVGSLYLTLMVNRAHMRNCDIAEELALKLRNRGVVLNVLKLSGTAINAKLASKSGDLSILGYTLPESPSTAFAFKTKSSLNYTNNNNKELDALYKAYDSNITVDKRNLTNQIDKLIVDTAPAIGIYSKRIAVMNSRKINGSYKPKYTNLYYDLAKCYVTY